MSWGTLATLAVVLVLATAVRVAVIGWQGHAGDVLVIHGWAERMADVGPAQFYEGMLVVYPALLYGYWILGVLFDGASLDVAIKASSIPFDLAIGVVLFLVTRRLGSDDEGVAASALYLLNPAVILAGPIWGQIDAAGTLFFLLALVAVAGSRWATAAALAVVAGLTKPQFGLVVLPVAALAVAAWRERRDLGPGLKTVTGVAMGYLAVAAPLLLDPLRYADQLSEIAQYKSEVSVGAQNPWAMLFGMHSPDAGLAWVGAGLLLIGLAASLLPLRHRRDLVALLAVGALITFAFYFLPTRVHERYLFPVVALLAPVAAMSLRSLVAYLVLSVAFIASLLAALWEVGSPTVPAGWGEALVSPTGTWIIGATLILAGAASVWLMVKWTPPVSAPRAVSAPRETRS